MVLPTFSGLSIANDHSDHASLTGVFKRFCEKACKILLRLYKWQSLAVVTMRGSVVCVECYADFLINLLSLLLDFLPSKATVLFSCFFTLCQPCTYGMRPL